MLHAALPFAKTTASTLPKRHAFSQLTCTSVLEFTSSFFFCVQLTYQFTFERPRALNDLKMLARVVRSTTQQLPTASKRCLSATASAAKAFQVSASPSAVTPPVTTVNAVSSGELAWCEIYGVDYDQQVQEALDEAPLLVNEVQHALPTRNATPTPTVNGTSDIWNVVFGSAAAA